jgi:hypothetical protein
MLTRTPHFGCRSESQPWGKKLYKVLGIINHRVTADGKSYAVKWRGLEPATQDPWPTSWVHESNIAGYTALSCW